MDQIQQKVNDFFLAYPEHHLPAHQLVLDGHTDPSKVYYVESGRVRQYSISSETGGIMTVHIFHAGSYFPLMYALAGKKNHYFFDSLEPTTLRVAPAADVENFLKENSDVLYGLTMRLLQGLEGLTNRLEVMAFSDVYGRLISHLLYLARHYGKTNDEGLLDIGHFTHQELSEYLGVTREATSIAMKKLERTNLVIHQDHRICVTDIEALRREFAQHLENRHASPVTDRE